MSISMRAWRDNIASANSLIKAGYTLYKPSMPLALSNSLYWKKQLRSAKMRKLDKLKD